ncbi:unnamed protein product [Cladocopium goreaui]|uniref:Uncharacterized protein n=1 Tax=Cladocopium goreaui TaxID=2562237 RepID=A0A9P1C216_9DINO|nr:unnamed protein product [Cladocopium goreaui]
MADEDQGWYEDPLGEESINANEEPNEGRPGTDDWSDWNEQEGGSQSTSRKRKNKEEPPSGLKWAKKTPEPPPQALSRWSSNSSWSSAGESPSTWNSWRGAATWVRTSLRPLSCHAKRPLRVAWQTVPTKRGSWRRPATTSGSESRS